MPKCVLVFLTRQMPVSVEGVASIFCHRATLPVHVIPGDRVDRGAAPSPPNQWNAHPFTRL
jgi:hypothetical protein